MKKAFVVALGVLGLAFPGVISAQGPDAGAAGDHLEAALVHCQELDYEACAEAAERALLREGELGDEERVLGYEVLGVAQVVLERRAQALATFEALLRLRPEHRLREQSPKVQLVFEEARVNLAQMNPERDLSPAAAASASEVPAMPGPPDGEADVALREQPASGDDRRWRRRLGWSLGALGVVAAAVVLGIVVAGGGDERSGTLEPGRIALP